MGYKLLGWLTWNAAKWFLRSRGVRVPVPLLAGGGLLAVAGVAMAAKRVVSS
jgi:hypothetical protein